MNASYIKENCCNVLGCRDEFIKEISTLNLQNQLKLMNEKVMSNQTDFIIKLLKEHSMVAEDIINFYMGEKVCLVIFNTRVGIAQTAQIFTKHVIDWSVNHDQ